ncbi:hypothetical protein BCR36DRAFT_144814 [Piromyces finnis]|uniref:G-protein coupled receptors family 1 profile domain-containing protein n=1 Tax=Piromyces finnis TaxID=1754191 RepID=A0A1Y1UYR9_9FUNG|nr:hypothetical protein BCR36DRAFT_144814 [Piromyces finnis]|eukprot:ORX43446.1 hypothetical protein BCR36DRAFT_144814 [Piromyces finnis]
MIEKREFFDFNQATSEEYNQYLERGFLDNEDHRFERTLYKILLWIFIFYGIASLYLFYKLRNSYNIRQRHFMLTFIGGIASYINIIIGFLPQLIPVTCSLTAFSANILNTFVNSIFLMRSLRVILYYHLNLFKVSAINKKKKKNNKYHDNINEPNYYLLKMSKRINYIIISLIAIPTLIAVILTVVLYVTDYENMSEKCP